MPEPFYPSYRSGYERGGRGERVLEVRVHGLEVALRQLPELPREWKVSYAILRRDETLLAPFWAMAVPADAAPTSLHAWPNHRIVLPGGIFVTGANIHQNPREWLTNARQLWQLDQAAIPEGVRPS